MELSDLSVRSFFELLGSDAAAPGGGSAAAMAASLGAALGEMVSALTVTRSQYAEFHEEARAGMESSAALRTAFLAAMERDTEAFRRYTAAASLPRETEEEKTLRTAAIREALILCIESPLHLMELSLDAVKLVERMVGKTNPAAVSDLGVAALMLGAAVQSAWLNVLINLGSLKDEAQTAAYRLRGEGLLRETLAHSQAVYDQVLNLL